MSMSFSWTKAALLGLVIAGLIIWVVDQRNRDEIARDHNALVCVTRPYIEQSRLRSVQARDDLREDGPTRERARQAVLSADQFLNGLITIPPHFKCGPLLKDLADGS